MLGIIYIIFKKNNIIFILSNSNNKLEKIFFGKTLISHKGKITREIVLIIYELVKKIKPFRFTNFIIKIKGFNKHRFSFLKELLKTRLEIIRIIDVTNNVFNGCRKKLPRCIEKMAEWFNAINCKFI